MYTILYTLYSASILYVLFCIRNILLPLKTLEYCCKYGACTAICILGVMNLKMSETLYHNTYYYSPFTNITLFPNNM